MSGEQLPRTGLGALTIGSASGLGFSVPLPLALAGIAVLMVGVGALLLRLTWRRRKPAGAR